jgi:hypothetical protein
VILEVGKCLRMEPGGSGQSMQRSLDIVQQLVTLHKQQVGTLTPAISDQPRSPVSRELDEYLRRSERIRELERELSIALEEERRKAV